MNTKQKTMYNNSLTGKDEKRRSLFSLLLLIFLTVTGCQDPTAIKDNPPPIPAGKGSFSIILSDTARTILPETPSPDYFTVYNLDFKHVSNGSAENVDRTNETLTDPIFLAPGTYNLVVSAYKDSEKEELAARGTLDGIIIRSGVKTSDNITLKGLLSEGTGTFTWNITFPAGVTANMTITPENESGADQKTVTLNQEGSGNCVLNSGEYGLIINMEKTDGKTVVWNELLCVYQNMESCFTFNFTDAHFNSSSYIITYNYNDGLTSNKPQSILHGDKMEKPADPTRNGFTFSGWYTDNAALENPWNFDNIIIESFTLYAGWWNGTENYPIPLAENTWTDGSITSSAGDSAVWYSFNVVSGRTYYVRWNDSKQGDNSKTLDVSVSAVYLDGTSIFSNVDSGFSTPRSFTANRTGAVLIKVIPLSGGSTGTFTAAYTTSSTWPYTVSFHANGGSGYVRSLTVNAGSSAVLPDGNGIEKSGYIFSGWNADASGMGTDYPAGSSFTPTGDTTLYARWSDGTEDYPFPLTEKIWADGTISNDSGVWYSINVVSGTTYNIWWNDSKNILAKTLDVSVSAFYRDGASIFTGVDSAFTSPQQFTVNTNGKVLLKVIPLSGGSTGTFAVVYSAVNTKPAFFTVSFDANGGSGAVPNPITVTENNDYGSYNITIPDGSGLTRNGRTFGGWNTNNYNSSENYRGEDYFAGSSYRINENITLYARWDVPLTANTWKDGYITYIASSVWYSFDVESGTRYSVWWNDNRQGNSTKISDISVSAYYSDGTSIFSNVDSGFSTPQQFIANRTGKVQIKVSTSSKTGDFAVTYTVGSTWTHTITFNTNGGNGAVPSRTVNAGSSTTLPNGSGLTKSGYTFIGWSTAADGTGTNYPADSSFIPIADITLYARWTYILTFNANGGSGTIPNMAVNPGSSITLPDGSSLTRSGYTFGGWDTDAPGTGTNYPAGSSLTPTGSTTLYARWYIEIMNSNWYSGSVASDSAVWASFNVQAGSQIYIWWSDRGNGDSHTADVIVSAYYSDGTSIFSNVDSGFSTPQQFTSNRAGKVLIRLAWKPNSYGTSGTFAVAVGGATMPQYVVTFNSTGGTGTFSTQYVQPGSSIILPSNITRSNYTFAGWNTAADGTGTNYLAGSSFRPYNSITLYARWNILATPLTINTWKNDNITVSNRDDGVWYTFYVTSGITYYLWWRGTRSVGGGGSNTTVFELGVSVYFEDGTRMFTSFAQDGSFKAGKNGMVRVKVFPLYNYLTGTFRIAYTTTNAAPPNP